MAWVAPNSMNAIARAREYRHREDAPPAPPKPPRADETGPPRPSHAAGRHVLARSLCLTAFILAARGQRRAQDKRPRKEQGNETTR